MEGKHGDRSWVYLPGTDPCEESSISRLLLFSPLISRAHSKMKLRILPFRKISPYTHFFFFMAVLELNLGLCCVQQAPTTWDIYQAALMGIISTIQLQASCAEPQPSTASLPSYDPCSDPDTRSSDYQCFFHASSAEILACLLPS